MDTYMALARRKHNICKPPGGTSILDPHFSRLLVSRLLAGGDFALAHSFPEKNEGLFVVYSHIKVTGIRDVASEILKGTLPLKGARILFVLCYA